MRSLFAKQQLSKSDDFDRKPCNHIQLLTFLQKKREKTRKKRSRKVHILVLCTLCTLRVPFQNRKVSFTNDEHCIRDLLGPCTLASPHETNRKHKKSPCSSSIFPRKKAVL
jgi:hypothetical protein